MFKIVDYAYTFDDVLLVPQYSTILPSDTILKTYASRNITLNIPIISAAMDNVTETKMAIAMAQEGGLGIIHKNMSPKQQADYVSLVKRHESGVVKNPITISPNSTLADLIKLTQVSKISGVPVVENNKLIGIITNRDIRFATDLTQPVKDLMTKKKYLITVLDGTNIDICIQLIKKHYPQTELIAGNVATDDAALSLANTGIDAIKVGIGSGSICTTRIVTGVGIPQLSAISNVAQAVKHLNIPVIADGGIRFSGDIAKAIAAGASSVMLGGILAGTDESPGEIELYQGISYKLYRGMGSISAMQQGSADRYSQASDDISTKLVPEGVEGRVPYKGSLSVVLHQLLGGLRSSMGYLGVKDIPQMQIETKFIKVTPAGMRESHVHDVQIIKEPPNYSISAS